MTLDSRSDRLVYVESTTATMATSTCKLPCHSEEGRTQQQNRQRIRHGLQGNINAADEVDEEHEQEQEQQEECLPTVDGGIRPAAQHPYNSPLPSALVEADDSRDCGTVSSLPPQTSSLTSSSSSSPSSSITTPPAAASTEGLDAAAASSSLDIFPSLSTSSPSSSPIRGLLLHWISPYSNLRRRTRLRPRGEFRPAKKDERFGRRLKIFAYCCGTICLLVAAHIVSSLIASTPWDMPLVGSSIISTHYSSFESSLLRGGAALFRYPEDGISTYFRIFGDERRRQRRDGENDGLPNRLQQDVEAKKISNQRYIPNSATSTRGSDRRRLADSTILTDPQLVIAGKMSVEDAPCNIAQYDLKEQSWSLTERIQLSLYNSYSGGEVYSLLANQTSASLLLDDENGEKTKPPSKEQQYEGSGELIVVGAFDTTYRNSQVTYCSVGKWDGLLLSKVGEGLCNSALSKGMKITTAALAGPQDVYVAGSFQTQVWNGDRHEFVKIFNIAHYNAVEQVWLPLNIGQITCSWCTVTVLALAWDSSRRQLHVAGKFNAIDGRNVPAGLAIYDLDSGHLVAHPGGGLSMRNSTQDGVGTALQLDEESGVLYVMGSFERLTATYEICLGLAAYEINTNRWTCLADAAHTVLPTGGGNMLLTPYGLMVAGKTTSSTTWPDSDNPYTIALLNATLKTRKNNEKEDKEVEQVQEQQYHEFDWSWLPGFDGHNEPLHALSNGFGDYAGTVFIAGDNLVAKWSFQQKSSSDNDRTANRALASSSSSSSSQPQYVAVTEILSRDHVRGAIMAISQMMPEPDLANGGGTQGQKINITIIVYCVAVGCVIGMFGAILCNRNAVFPFLGGHSQLQGISLDTLTYSAIENTSITDAYRRAMKTRYVQHPHLLTIIDPQEIFLQRIIGEGTFGRVWSAKWRSSSVAVKEFVFAQAAVAGKSSMQQEIVEEIIGEAGMMAILRHPNVLQLFGCSLTAQAIWIVSELCSLGSLRQVLDDSDRSLPIHIRVNLALQVAEGMTYLHNQDPPIIHRDLKSHNIFVHETFTDIEEQDQKKKKKSNKDKDKERGKGKENDDAGAFHRWMQPVKMNTKSILVAKIGDWGSARATLSGSRTMTHGVGTACWLAPEVIKHARSSKYSDVYGYGIVLWELATREEVYQGLETTQIIAKVANESLRPPVPEECPWKDVMVKCWEEKPQDRLDFNEIVVALNSIFKQLTKYERRLTKGTETEGYDDRKQAPSDSSGGGDNDDNDDRDSLLQHMEGRYSDGANTTLSTIDAFSQKSDE